MRANFNFRLVLYILFFCSGCSALIYQLMWQRMLFTQFGVDLESITIIVSVFMFGLGVGGLLGGIVADGLHGRLLQLYIAIEIGIAVFGFLSPNMIDTLGNLTVSHSGWITGMWSFVILAFPTILMGATFPILVTHVSTMDQNIGKSVGELYFANTLGGAIGACLSGFILLNIIDMIGVIQCAAYLNLIVAIVAFLVFSRTK